MLVKGPSGVEIGVSGQLRCRLGIMKTRGARVCGEAQIKLDTKLTKTQYA